MAQDNKFIPFYSEVHPDIRNELLFRASCAIDNTRTPEQLEWMYSRSSWGSVTIFESDKKTVRATINTTPDSLEGADDTNNKKISYEVATGVKQNSDNTPISYNPLISNYLAANYINTRSGRTPPALQSITFSLADTSAGAQGLLNDAQVSILVTDIEYFVNEFERLWFRLGNKAIIEIGHSVRSDERGNRGRFEGILVNFNFEYQKDGTVNVVLYFKASTDLVTVIPATNTTPSKEEETTGNVSTQEQKDKLLSTKLNSIAEKEFSAEKQTNENQAKIFPVNYIENEILPDVSDTLVDAELNFRILQEYENSSTPNNLTTVLTESGSLSPADKTTYDIFMAQIGLTSNNTNNEDDNETMSDGTQSGTAYYVSLGMIIKLLNANLHAATSVTGSGKTPLDTVYISVAPEFSTSLYFEELVSADHEKVILPSSENFNSDVYVSINTVTRSNESTPLRLGNITSVTSILSEEPQNLDRISFYKKSTDSDTIIGVPANILIRIDAIRDIELNLKLNESPDKPYDVDLFVNKISKLINKCTSGAINLKLTSIPSTNMPGTISTLKNKNMLILKDIVAAVPEQTNTIPTKIPMFVNSLNQFDSDTKNALLAITGKAIPANAIYYKRAGTVVRDFKIVGRIPNSLKSINLILSQTSGIPQDMLAHYLTYIETEDDDEKKQVSDEYEKAYIKNLNNLIAAKLEYYKKPFNDDVKLKLQEALKSYVSVPKENLSKLFKFTSPPYPLDVEIELDGCYGFRFGDVITVEGLPAQYNNFVFSITKIDHSLLANDWSTKITCLMRPKIN